MFKNFFKTLFGKKSSDEDTRKIEDSCNYWADKDAVDYSPSFTAQDVLSSTETVNASDTTLSKETEEDKKEKVLEMTVEEVAVEAALVAVVEVVYNLRRDSNGTKILWTTMAYYR